mgnify:CR=1 FL=1
MLNPIPLDGTYELCGEKVQGNPEKIEGHHLIMHGKNILPIINFDFYRIKHFLENTDIEGIVFHHLTSMYSKEEGERRQNELQKLTDQAQDLGLGYDD